MDGKWQHSYKSENKSIYISYLFFFLTIYFFSILPIFIENESLRDEIAELRRKIFDLKAEYKGAKKKIRTLVIINKELNKESDLQFKTAGSDILESDESEDEGKDKGKEKGSSDDGSSSEQQPPSTTTVVRSFDLKAA